MLKDFRHDLRSSLVGLLVALPLCLRIAPATGAPIFSRVFSGIVGGIFVAYFSHSTFSVSGPSEVFQVLLGFLKGWSRLTGIKIKEKII